MAGSAALHAAVADACGPGVRVIGAPCIGRCEHAPAAVVGRPTNGSPARESDPVPPVDDGPAGQAGPGQELSLGEG